LAAIKLFGQDFIKDHFVSGVPYSLLRELPHEDSAIIINFLDKMFKLTSQNHFTLIQHISKGRATKTIIGQMQKTTGYKKVHD
jgi:hypothetical protein